MSALCFILMLLLFITIPTIIYTFCHILKFPPNTLLPAPPPPTRGAQDGLKAAAADSVVVRMELVTVVDVGRLEGEEAGGDCPVCLSEFEDGEELWRLKLCGHIFHAPCIEPWLRARSSCPVCRAYVLFSNPPKRSLVVPASLEGYLWQGLPDSSGLV